MEFKHFSHHHLLAFHHPQQVSQSQCSGCKSPVSGNVYACWQCGYFLHEQCFHAARSVKHASHPLHPLTLVPSPTHPSSSFLCDFCNLSGDGFSYSCSHCDFDLHLHCAVINPNSNPHASPSPVLAHNLNTPTYPPPAPLSGYPPPNATLIPNQSQNTTLSHQEHNCTPHHHHHQQQQQQDNLPPLGYPQSNINAKPQNSTPKTNTIKHFSHSHSLKQMEIINGESTKLCSACELTLSGSAYCCGELHCNFTLHKACFDSPREVRHKSHPHHPLTLLSTAGSYTCDACRKGGKGFSYTCRACTHDLHIDCIRWPETLTRPDHEHSLDLYYEAKFASGVSGGEVFLCSACWEAVDEKAWVYYCKGCDFGTHLECVNAEIQPQSDSGGDAASAQIESLKLQQQQMNLNFQLQMAKQQAAFITSIANSWSNF